MKDVVAYVTARHGYSERRACDLTRGHAISAAVAMVQGIQRADYLPRASKPPFRATSSATLLALYFWSSAVGGLKHPHARDLKERDLITATIAGKYPPANAVGRSTESLCGADGLAKFQHDRGRPVGAITGRTD
jgi:hypothetical protein